jgi:hypothetical protein
MKNAPLALIAMALATSACDKVPEQPAGVPGGTTPVATGSGEARGSDAVKAVLQSPGTPVASLEFVLDARPVAGKPFALQLRVAAAQPLPALQLVAESSSLIVAPASATLVLETANAPATQDMVVTAPKPGLADLMVRLKSGDAPETVYAVPVLVAAPAAAGE